MSVMLKKLLEVVPAGSDITIMNAMYNYSKKDENTGKWMDDYISLVYKDNATNTKKHIIIPQPKYTFYKLKDGIDASYNRLFVELDKVVPISVPFSKLSKEIATATGNEAFYNDIMNSGDKSALYKLHLDPRLFCSDRDVADHYRFEFGKLYTNNIIKLKKAFYDIEVDGRYGTHEFPLAEECPINAISMYDESNKIVVTYLLRNSQNPLIDKLEKDYTEGRFTNQDILNFIQTAVGGYKPFKRFGLDLLHFKLVWFDSELEMLETFFQTVYYYDPDFIMGWNSSGFDLPFILERIIRLGGNPEDIATDPKWPVKFVKHYVDQRNYNDFANRGDYTNISCNPVWMDQMIQFCSRRKAKMGSFSSFKLDDIGFSEAKVKKLDYSHITDNLSELPYLDYKTFVLYNIMDVIVQKCIEAKANDLEYIFAKCVVNDTSYRRGHRQTIYLINRMAKEWFKLGFIIGNNINRDNPKPEKFLGALVGKPLNTNDFSKVKINGVPIMVCDNLNDFDFKSLYPSVILQFNIAPNTQIGYIDIPEKVYDNENAYHLDKYSRSGEFIENLTSDNLLEFSHRWLHLAGFKEFLEDWAEYNQLRKVQYSSVPMFGIYGKKDGRLAVCPVISTSTPTKAVSFNKTTTVPIVLFNTRKETA